MIDERKANGELTTVKLEELVVALFESGCDLDEVVALVYQPESEAQRGIAKMQAAQVYGAWCKANVTPTLIR